MLLLTSPNDQLLVATNSAATISVHATWVDTNTATGTITPGRTNSAISAATSTSVAGSPAAGVQRNVKTLHIRNNHPSLVSEVLVQHTDGTTYTQLYKCTLPSARAVQYTDQGGFTLSPQSGAAIRTFTGAGVYTYTPTVGMRFCIIEVIGGGGGGGNAVADVGQQHGGGGGGAGGYSRKYADAVMIGVYQSVTVGVGGANNTDGQPSNVGALCSAYGGKAGSSGSPTSVSTGGAGGAPGAGDVGFVGAPGMGGIASLSQATLQGSFGAGGSSAFGGGAQAAQITGVVNDGVAAFAYGSGGSGGISNSTPSLSTGGHGSDGIVIITEYF
jgi:hypothetical protein